MEIVGRAPFSRNQLKLNKSGGRTGRRRKVANSPLSRVENFDRRNVAYTRTRTHARTLGRLVAENFILRRAKANARPSSAPLSLPAMRLDRKISRTVGWIAKIRAKGGTNCPTIASPTIYILYIIYSLSITRSFYDRFTRLHRERSARDICISWNSYRESTNEFNS